MGENGVKVKLLLGEYWWGGAVMDGIYMPYGDKNFKRELNPNKTFNQAVPFLVSNKGRYIWSDDPFDFRIEEGFLYIENCEGEIIKEEGFDSLKEAYKAAQNKHFPPSGKLPEELLFTAPQYNTWIELMYDQREDKILEYAQSIIDNGFPPGILMVDDNWQEDYGVWKFHAERFKNPKGMINKLHDLGFKVMLWVCPFVSPDSATFRDLAKKDFFIKDGNGEIAIREWWNGFSAVLDFTNEEVCKYFYGQLKSLVDEYGVDGFKFDAGDPVYYSKDDNCHVPSHPNVHCEKYGLFGLEFKLNEFRACWKNGGQPLVQRLSDKAHSWGYDGLATLIPNGLAQGLMGYSFVCPDMIGGGEYQSFLASSNNLDEELFVRYAQCSALFPMMQFSAAPWRVLSKKYSVYCLQAALLHKKMGLEILEIAKRSAITGEPIIRPMAYEFPEGNYENIHDQFMLGENILVAPVLKKGMTKRKVIFPKGKWQDGDGDIIEGPKMDMVDAPINKLPWFRKID